MLEKAVALAVVVLCGCFNPAAGDEVLVVFSQVVVLCGCFTTIDWLMILLSFML